MQQLLFVCLLTTTAGLLMLWNVPLCKKRGKLSQVPALSIIIPARNEAENLPVLLASIQEQKLSAAEVIVVDDGSVDRTAEAARKFGAKVRRGSEDSQGKGKAAACWQGAKAAKGAWLIFMDADTWFADPDSLARIVIAYQQQGGTGALSIQPYHDIRKLNENFSAIFNILTMAGMNVFSFLGRRLPKAGLFGPFLLCRKEDYLKIAGQPSVQKALVEGFALGDKFREEHLPSRLYGGKESVHFRMYPSGIKQMVEGWSKHFASGAKRTHFFIWILISFWITGAFLTTSFLVLAAADGQLFTVTMSVGCYLFYFTVFFLLARKTGSFNSSAALFFPLQFVFFLVVFLFSLIQTYLFRSVTWKGRKINL